LEITRDLGPGVDNPLPAPLPYHLFDPAVSHPDATLLVGHPPSPRQRVGCLLLAVVAFCLPAAAWYGAAKLGWVPLPAGSTGVGLTLGMLAAAIIAFEMLLWPRKQLRGYRFGRAKTWMFWHVWLGLFSLPVAVIHTGFRFGGPLPAAVLILFLVVIASGIWGLAMQQVLTHKLLHDFPTETVETEVDAVMAHHAAEAERLVEGAATGGPADPLRALYREEIEPYLTAGRASGSALASASRAAGLFADLAARAPAAERVVRRLEELCAARRQYDQQARIHVWLHNWVLVHLPLSVALTVLLAAHAVTALKYW
jgi:uncharacterized membrane protein